MTRPTCTYGDCDFTALVELTWPDDRVESLCWAHQPLIRELPAWIEQRRGALRRILAAEAADRIKADS